LITRRIISFVSGRASNDLFTAFNTVVGFNLYAVFWGWACSLTIPLLLNVPFKWSEVKWSHCIVYLLYFNDPQSALIKLSMNFRLICPSFISMKMFYWFKEQKLILELLSILEVSVFRTASESLISIFFFFFLFRFTKQIF